MSKIELTDQEIDIACSPTYHYVMEYAFQSIGKHCILEINALIQFTEIIIKLQKDFHPEKRIKMYEIRMILERKQPYSKKDYGILQEFFKIYRNIWLPWSAPTGNDDVEKIIDIYKNLKPKNTRSTYFKGIYYNTFHPQFHKIIQKTNVHAYSPNKEKGSIDVFCLDEKIHFINTFINEWTKEKHPLSIFPPEEIINLISYNQAPNPNQFC
ncbi:MAG: hypothetical protein Satyrvirus12_14 [Satyrvirus sp.]|uniref:Uncharacterized protein n=1 Tax=Satyrvirus sp. TaxID=2487771 RepID=A0A3G5ADV6_9VIRU|nr:MAG: hypothetical protein Satyrvirus12_14 [Satyrvirus sp.]